MAKQEEKPKADETPDYSFRELERAFKKNLKAVEALQAIPQSPDVKSAIKSLETNNELIKKKAYQMVDAKFNNV